MSPARLTRARLLGAGAVGAGAAFGAGFGVDRLLAGDASLPSTVPFYGPHQTGIVTPVQARLHFASFDVTLESRRELRDLMRAWSEAAAHMCAGRPVGTGTADPAAPPHDTGEALGLPPERLTVTFGFGPTLFSLEGTDRFGLARARPGKLGELPAFAGDELDPDRSGGDLAVQACADDPQVAFHAVRNLARIGRGAVVMRWSQLGFGRTSTTSRTQPTPRNLMGFKDGTNNIRGEDERMLAEHVWVGRGDGPAWLQDGTYLVTRRIRMLIEVWDRASLADQEATIGRQKETGAPLGKHDEFDPVDLSARDETGELVVATDAHVRLAAPALNGGARILRRGYSFTDGMDTRLGQLDAGLFFVSYQRDPAAFVQVQQRLARSDALNEYIKHTGSALFACPPGVRPGDYVGSTLLA
jgi:deferrochelatase/peroxidase EfeB